MKDLKLRTASLLRLSSQVLHSFLLLTQGGVDDPKTIIGERSVVAGRALTERGRPRPRERLPKELCSEGWMERSGTLSEPSGNSLLPYRMKEADLKGSASYSTPVRNRTATVGTGIRNSIH